MRKRMFYVYQNEHCWQFYTVSVAVAVLKWREHGGFVDGTKVAGRPDKVTYDK